MKLPEFVKGFSVSKDESQIEDVIVPIKEQEQNKTNEKKYNSMDKTVPSTLNVSSSNDGKSGSYIAQDVVIKGVIECNTDITIAGRVLDNVISRGNILLRGSIEGDCVEAKSLEMQNASVIANITVSESVTVSKESVIKGNINARNIDIAGVVEGNITVSDNAVVKSGAGILGNISVGSFVVERGAKISGQVKVIDTTEEPQFRKRDIESASTIGSTTASVSSVGSTTASVSSSTLTSAPTSAFIAKTNNNSTSAPTPAKESSLLDI